MVISKSLSSSHKVLLAIRRVCPHEWFQAPSRVSVCRSPLLLRLETEYVPDHVALAWLPQREQGLSAACTASGRPWISL
jgi:hypothetical protein